MNIDSGPAFPYSPQQQYAGITMRDYFAAKALECVISLISDNDKAAQEAYEIADAMIKARA